MKRLFLLFASLLALCNARSQELKLKESLSQNETSVVERRISNKALLQHTLNYAPLSYVSPPYLDVGNPKTAYILSADIMPQFVIGGEWMPIPIHLTPRFKARIFRNNLETNDTSLPVRTPSFMPGMTAHIPLQDYSKDTGKIKYASIAIFHHSNGQDGDEFNSDERINLYNGNFSTNYVEPAFHYRIRRFQSIGSTDCSDPEPNYSEYYFKLGMEKHFVTAEKLKSTYGDYRFNFTVNWIGVRNYCDMINKKQISSSYYREKHRIVFSSTFIAGNREGGLNDFNKRINVNINYNWRIPSSPNTALFLGTGYYGSDPYNIYYQQSYFFVHAGLSLGFFVTPNMIGLK